MLQRHLPGAAGHGVFRASVRVLFEVAQATLSNWNYTESDDDDDGTANWNIYLEVFLEKQKKVRLKCCKKKGKKGKKGQQRGQTTQNAECPEMRWRSVDDENFRVALFTLGKPNWRVAEGTDLKIFAEVFRVKAKETDDGALEEEPPPIGRKVCFMEGTLAAGAVGLITLRPQSDFTEDEEAPELTLELRPPSSRSFTLDEAQPREKHPTIEEIWADTTVQRKGFRRMQAKRLSGRVSAVLSGGRDRESVGGGRYSYREGVEDNAPPNETNVQRARRTSLSNREGPLVAKKSSIRSVLSAGSSNPTGGGGANQGDAPESPTTPRSSRRVGGGDFATGRWQAIAPTQVAEGIASANFDASNTKDTSASYKSVQKRYSLKSSLSRLTFTEFDGSNGEKKTWNPVGGMFRGSFLNIGSNQRLSTPGSGQRSSHNNSENNNTGDASMMVRRKSTNPRPREASQGQSLRPRFNLLKTLIGKLKPQEKRPYDDWVPTDWAAAWKSPWPIHGDDLGSKWEVVELMEAEFRRDCVIFFNTLFPRVRSKQFALLRSIAASMQVPKQQTKSAKSLTQGASQNGNKPPRHWISVKLSTRNKLVDEEFDERLSESSTTSELTCVSTLTKRHSVNSFAAKWYLLGPAMSMTEDDRPQYIEDFANMYNGKLHDLVKDYAPRIWFLKRLMICFASCGLHYNEGGNSVQVGELWPYPLASILGHGSRILIRLEDVEGSEFLNFLLTGDPHSANWKESGMPYPLKARAAATHSVQLERETGHLIERKLKTTNAVDTLQNIVDGLDKKHLGLNMPIGGAGNQSPLGVDNLVGFSGRVIRKDGWKNTTERWYKKVVKKISRILCCKRRKPSKKGSSAKNSPKSFILIDADQNGKIQSTPSQTELTQQPTQKSLSSDGSSCESAAEAPFQVASSMGFSVHVHHREQHGETWRQVPKVQGGHLYIRVDDFGEHDIRHMGTDNVLSFSTRAEEKRRLEERARKGFNLTEQAILRWRLENARNGAGIVFFPSSVPALHKNCKEHLQEAEAVAGVSARFPKLVRMRSEPCIKMAKCLTEGAEAAQWVSSVLKTVGTNQTPSTVDPPSAEALRLLLEHFNPLSASLIGKSNFKSVEDLFHEINTGLCCIFIDKQMGNGLQRYVEPVVLQLRFRGRLLMKTHERNEGEETSVQRNTFICTRATEEGNWRQALRDVLEQKLSLSEDVLQDSLEIHCRDEKNNFGHSVLEETMVSPSYPGLTCHYRTHMLQWDISEDCDIEVFRRHGLPLNTKARKKRQHNCDFTTTVKMHSGMKKTLYWSWVPEVEARRIQKWVNLGDASIDERWARYAFQREGAVQFPPTEAALKILLKRCGIDVSRFGSGTRSLTALWRELTNQEAYLQMTSGKPLLAIEHTVVMVRWRHQRDRPYQLLVQVREEHPDGRANESKKLLGGRKLKEETWSKAALQVVRDAFQITKQQVTSLLEHSIDDAAEYSFVEEQEEATRFPGIDTLLRTHLVTYTLKGDAGTLAHGRAILGVENVLQETATQTTLASRSPAKTKQLDDEVANLPLNRTFETEIHTRFGSKITEYQWVLLDEVDDEVDGMGLFRKAASRVERHKISSILIGLEGADPGNVSAFGQGHDASGASSKISASGGRKWRGYRTNAALQIPADIGGMRMRVSRKMFDQFMKNCESIDLLDPTLDILWEAEAAYPRELLEHHFAEKELYKRILMGSAVQANQAVEWMKSYRELHKTPEQVHQALQKRRNARGLRLQRMAGKGILKRGHSNRGNVGIVGDDDNEKGTRFADEVYESDKEGSPIDLHQHPQLSILEGDVLEDPRGPLLPSPPLTSSPYLPSSISPVADQRKNLARILPSRPYASPSFSPNGKAYARPGSPDRLGLQSPLRMQV